MRKMLDVVALGPKGDGISFSRGETIYVNRCLPGDRVNVNLHRDRLGVLRGEPIEILAPSALRKKAPCPHFDLCGNCTIQHANSAFYKNWKIDVVKEALSRHKISPQEWLPAFFTSSHSRRRATFSAKRKGHRILLGYYHRRSKDIVDIPSCLVIDSKLMKLGNILLPFLPNFLYRDLATDFFFQLSDTSPELIITGPLGYKGSLDSRVRGKVKEYAITAGLGRVGWRRSEKHKIQLLFNFSPLLAKFGKLTVNLPPFAFLQPTLEGERELTKRVVLSLGGAIKFADLFSGCGTFTGHLLSHGSVTAFEIVPEAVSALKKAGKAEPLTVHQRDLISNPLRSKETVQYDAIVFDPPRGGCKEQAYNLAKSRVPILIGISCNPATFARDAKILCCGGYRLKSIQVVDQFLWSHHVEVVGVFTKQ